VAARASVAHGRALGAADPNTGGPGQPAPICVGAPRIGSTFSLDIRTNQYPIPYCHAGRLVLLLMGVPLATPIVIGWPTTCNPWPPCVLGCAAIAVFPFVNPSFALPPDPTLIGGRFCAQGGCVEAAWCWSFSASLRITIQP
jgi:hypothetical protein